MVLKNFFVLLAGKLGNEWTYPIGPSGSSVGVNNNKSGSCVDLYYTLNNGVLSQYTPSGVVFGTGNTPPTVDDYALAGDIVTGLVASKSYTYTKDDNGVTYEVVYTLTNSTSNDVTIAEVATMAHSAACLIERTVLEEPVTIPAGGVGQVTYTIRMNYPT